MWRYDGHCAREHGGALHRRHGGRGRGDGQRRQLRGESVQFGHRRMHDNVFGGAYEVQLSALLVFLFLSSPSFLAFVRAGILGFELRFCSALVAIVTPINKTLGERSWLWRND